MAAQTAWYKDAFGLRSVVDFHLEGPGPSGVVLEHPDGWRVELLVRPGSTPGLGAPDPLTAAAIEGYGHFAVTTPELDPVHTALLADGAGEVMAPGPSPEPGVRASRNYGARNWRARWTIHLGSAICRERAESGSRGSFVKGPLGVAWAA
ncbi:VOC family protein [Streptomyces sp. NPDC003233]